MSPMPSCEPEWWKEIEEVFSIKNKKSDKLIIRMMDLRLMA